MPDFLSADFPGGTVGANPTKRVRDGMRAALAEACGAGRPAACLALELEGAGDEGEAWLARVGGLVGRLPRAGDLYGLREDDRLVLFLPGADPADADRAAAWLLDEVRALGASAAGAPARLCVGVARQPAKGRALHLETLVEVAVEGVAVARAGGGNRAAHTELYETFERRRAASAQARPAGGSPVPLEQEPEAAPHEATHETPRGGPHASTAPPSPRASGRTPLVLPEAHNQRERELFEALRREIEDLDVVGADADGRRQQLLDEAVQRARDEWASAALRLTTDHAKEVELLQRRIAKLSESLELTERELQRAARESGDSGIASIYREVQGLLPEDEQHELKRELMGMIFRANLDLRRRLDESA